MEETGGYIEEWTRKSVIAEDFTNEIKQKLLDFFPTKEDFKENKPIILAYILRGFKESDQQDYEESGKNPGVMKWKRIRKRIQQRMYRFFDRLHDSIYNEMTEVTTNNSVWGLFPDIEETAIREPVLPVDVSRQVMEDLTSQLNDKLSIMNDLVENEEVAEVAEAEEVAELPVCIICLDELTKENETIRCYENNHPMHSHCRWYLAANGAKQIKHKCPTCRQNIEVDGGKEFSKEYELKFSKSNVRESTSSTTSSSSSRTSTTPIVTRSLQTNVIRLIERCNDASILREIYLKLNGTD